MPLCSACVPRTDRKKKDSNSGARGGTSIGLVGCEIEQKRDLRFGTTIIANAQPMSERQQSIDFATIATRRAIHLGHEIAV